jgi:hypothetical protein
MCCNINPGGMTRSIVIMHDVNANMVCRRCDSSRLELARGFLSFHKWMMILFFWDVTSCGWVWVFPISSGMSLHVAGFGFSHVSKWSGAFETLQRWEQTAIISLYSINWLVFITETECVYCAVRSTFYVLPTQCIYVFCLDLRTNSDYFTVQH